MLIRYIMKIIILVLQLSYMRLIEDLLLHHLVQFIILLDEHTNFILQLINLLLLHLQIDLTVLYHIYMVNLIENTFSTNPRT